MSSHHAGTRLVVRKKTDDYVVFQCYLHRIHRGKSLAPGVTYEEGIRKVTAVNDQHINSRGRIGMKMNRKSTATRKTESSLCCKLRLTVAYCKDVNGYYVKSGIGCNFHSNHPETKDGNDLHYKFTNAATKKTFSEYSRNMVSLIRFNRN